MNFKDKVNLHDINTVFGFLLSELSISKIAEKIVLGQNQIGKVMSDSFNENKDLIESCFNIENKRPLFKQINFV